MSEPAVLCSLNVDVTDRLTNRRIDMTSDRPLVGGGIKLGVWRWGKNQRLEKKKKGYCNTILYYFDSNFTIFMFYGVENQIILRLAREENQSPVFFAHGYAS